jgi:hypothetical protein
VQFYYFSVSVEFAPAEVPGSWSCGGVESGIGAGSGSGAKILDCGLRMENFGQDNP